MPGIVRVGVISDTHGTLDPRILEAFADVAHIVHAGDVGGPEILARLERVAPVTAVRGNTDGRTLPWLDTRESVRIAGCGILILHDLDELAGRVPPGTEIVVSGHTHVPVGFERAGVRFVNPGSASRPRGHSRRSIAIIEIAATEVGTPEIDVRIVEI